MQPNARAEGDRTAEVAPELHPTAPWRVVTVAASPDACLSVAFVDGTKGEVRMASFLANPKVVGSPFEALRDAAIFAQARVVLGAVQWPNGADLAPDAMYD